VSDTDEVFDPLKGYEDGREPTSEEEARNALYQGFVTEWEFAYLRVGFAIIDHNSYLIWLTVPTGHDVPPEKRLLSRDRMLLIQADHLLGIGDGKTIRD